MELTTHLYRATKGFPPEEMYGLSSQLRRAAVSVASNIAEGKGRFSDKELMQFLSRARGSIYEIQTQLEIAGSLGYLSHAELNSLSSQARDIGRMLNAMMARFRQTIQDSAA